MQFRGGDVCHWVGADLAVSGIAAVLNLNSGSTPLKQMPMQISETKIFQRCFRIKHDFEYNFKNQL